MPQNEAGIRIEQPKSVPCASGTMPVATATADPPEDPAGLKAGFQGFRVTPNTSLKVRCAGGKLRGVGLAQHDRARRFQAPHGFGISVGTLSANSGEP
jgi:hypothetical protein